MIFGTVSAFEVMKPLGMGVVRGQWLNDCGNVEKRAAGEKKGYTGPPAQRINTSNSTSYFRAPKSADKSESKDGADRGGKREDNKPLANGRYWEAKGKKGGGQSQSSRAFVDKYSKENNQTQTLLSTC